MILRRFMQHIKEQNWFAVGLDVLVVIVGIFLGMQVQQWYEKNQFNEFERSLLSQLKNEITNNQQLTENRIDFMKQVMVSGERGISFLETSDSCKDDCWRLLVDFFSASQSLFAPVTSNVYQEIQRLGLPRNNNLKRIVEQYYLLSATTFASIERRPEYRKHIRKLLSAKAHKVLWENCHYIDGSQERHLNDCEQMLPDEEISKLLNRIRENSEILDQLQYWIGMHYLWVPVYESQINYGQEAIVAIDEFL